MSDWITLCAAITAISATGFVVVAVMWLRKLRETVSTALAEAASQQVRTAQRLTEAIAQVEKRQRGYEQQIQALSQANTQLRQGLANVTTRLELNPPAAARGDQTVH